MKREPLPWAFLVLATLMALMISGCGASSTTIDGSQVGPSPIILEDTSASQLAVFISINVGGYDLATRNKAVLDINFQHTGRPVNLVAGEKLTCSTLKLTWHYGGGFEFEFEVGANGISATAIACTYDSHGRSAPLIIPLPPILEVVSPVDHAGISRGPSTIVRYRGAKEGGMWVVALSSNAKASAEVADMTATEAILDTSRLTAGEGSIALTDPNNFPLVGIDGPSFQSVQGSARRSTFVPVVWM